MKKLVFLFTAVLLTAISANVFAQGSGAAPAIGSIHGYEVTPTTGNLYSWSITSDYQGNTDVASTVASFIGTGNDKDSVSILWENPIIGTTYFVHVTETEDGCTNRKVLAVTPVNNFALDIVSVDLTDADAGNGDNFEICAADISIDGYDSGANTFTYNYHKDSVYYKVIASGINLENTNWSPQFTISHDGISGTSVTAGWATAIDGSYTTLDTDGSVNDIDVTPTETTTGEIWIKVVIDNSTTNEGLSKNDIVVDLAGESATSEDGNGNDVTSTGNDKRTQSVKARPATSGIATDN